MALAIAGLSEDPCKGSYMKNRTFNAGALFFAAHAGDAGRSLNDLKFALVLSHRSGPGKTIHQT